MLQTNPSGPALGALSLEPPPKARAEKGIGSEEFSQEYEKQVKSVESQGRAEEASKPEESAKAEQAEERAEVEQAAGEESPSQDQAANDEKPEGKSLPLQEMRQMAEEIGADKQVAAADEELAITNEVTSATMAEAKAEGEPKVEGELKLKDESELKLDEETDEAGGPAAVAAQPLEEAAKPAAPSLVAAAVREAVGSKEAAPPEPDSDIAVSDELVVKDGELAESTAKQRGKEGGDLASLLARQQKDVAGSEQLPRGERGFDAALSTATGRATPAAAAIDTLTPTIAPLAGQGAAAPLATPAPVSMNLPVPMQQQANWNQAMGERVVWMTNAKIQEAEIQLHPREMGPIGIKITMEHDQAHVSFVAHNATTRDALENAIPRLREMLSEQGLQLGQSDVSQHSFKGRDDNAAEGSGAGGSGELADEGVEGDESLHLGDMAQGVGYVSPSGVNAYA